ncbi:MAG TPA: hypothetical protein DDZ51_05905 [Planctomycetaceae bacterium]|nr:hypothetical protein [Planctomycetaceae bacterium]
MITKVSVSSTDVPFVFNESSWDVQDATIQGDLTYQIIVPRALVYAAIQAEPIVVEVRRTG